MKAIAFDVNGDLALFRKFYTNSSMLTYPFPPPTAILGTVGAILGIPKDKYISELSNIQVSVVLLQPVKKIRFSLNYINTKDGDFTLGKGRTQIPTEMVKNPAYRIYVRNLNEYYEQNLVSLLKDHRCVFTPYLGISEFLANFHFHTYHDCLDQEGKADVISVVPLNKARVRLKEGLKLGKERVPFRMNDDRSVKEYIDVVFEADANAVPIEGSYSVVDQENVIFF